MNDIKQLPDLRFKNYSDDWLLLNLSEVASFSKGIGYSKSDLVPFGFPIILYGRLYTNYQTVISNVNTFVKSVSKDAVISKGNEVILPASGETPEDIARASAVGQAGVILGGDLNIVHPNSTIDSPFFALRVSNGNCQKELSKRAQGKSVVHIRNTDIKDLSARFPKSINEQIDISNYFKNIDVQIKLHQDKHRKLIELKKAMLSKMFPKSGSSIPEVRFSGFSKEWTVSPAKDLCSISTGKSNTQDKVVDGKFPFYVRSANIERSNRYLYDEEAVLTVGDGVGTGKVYHYVNGKYDLHQRVYRMFNFKSVVGSFFYLYFSENFGYRVNAMTAKTSVDSVRLDMIADMEIQYPCDINEQIKIGEYFQNFEKLISLQKAKVNKLKNLKKAYLKQMFV